MTTRSQPTTTSTSEPSTGRIVQINVSGGGVPKLPIERATVTELGIVGDKQRDKVHHGGPERALCLFAFEVIEQLQAEGHPISAGAVGENLTVAGLPAAALRPGARLRLGADVVIEMTKYTTPCANIAASFTDGDFSRILQSRRPDDSRIYARVLHGGELATGDPITVEALGAE